MEDKDLIYTAAKLCIEHNQCSINFIQSMLNIGFNRAAVVVNALEELHIVTPKYRKESRKVIVQFEDLDRIITSEAVKNAMEKKDEPKNTGLSLDTDLIYDVAKFCIENKSCTINSIQMEFGLGFNRAARIIDVLEDLYIVTPKNENGVRQIIAKFEDLEKC